MGSLTRCLPEQMIPKANGLVLEEVCSTLAELGGNENGLDALPQLVHDPDNAPHLDNMKPGHMNTETQNRCLSGFVSVCIKRSW